ncbi:hypothetical protein DFA_08455 [Cavenderia fasciculata]|uniref:F-box/LRR-repeat protein 15-like leucin rich repeat domain-containing protein n=1 Tax=Cavenderia fasciculata TaxID=261658 RepID=F4Q686_CACFS|nr:uncharacterized protein DFA_08455 [Cavenderia fasciculata]EGG17460.1 hypothetical protein DFA_08455 [Cavenderia fasciculata]|eukprot:XP_004355944.1 hypothetical protein DFA_08455 [Cavenderia fasciculata]
MDDLAELRRQRHAQYLRQSPPSTEGDTSPPPTIASPPIQPAVVVAPPPPNIVNPNNANLIGGHPNPFANPHAPPMMPHPWFNKKAAAVSSWSSSSGHRLGDGTESEETTTTTTNKNESDDVLEEELMEEDQETTNQMVQPTIENDESFDDDGDNSDSDNEDQDNGDEDEDMMMPPNGGMMMPPGGFVPGMGMMPGMGFNHFNQFQAFGGTGHTLQELNPSLESSKPKEKGEIADMIKDRISSLPSDQAELYPKPAPRVFERDIKKLVDICLLQLIRELQTHLSKLKILSPELVYRMIELMKDKGRRVERKAMDQLKVAGVRLMDMHLDHQDLLVNNNFVLNCLPGFVYLHTISFVGCSNVTDTGMEGFKTMTNLTSLNLTGTRISDVSLKFIRRLTLLRSLSLRNTGITEKGVLLLSPLSKLESLDLTNLLLTDTSMLTVATFSNLNTLLLGNALVTEKGINDISNLPITTLSLLHCKKINNASMVYLTKYQNTLESLDITGTMVMGMGFIHLKRFKKLRDLQLPNRLCITDDTIKHLDSLEFISKLHLSDYTQITSITSIPNLKRLVDLSLSNTKISDDSIPTILKYLNLEHLNLDRTNVTDFGVSQLAVLQLTTLSLSSTKINGTCFPELSGITLLKWLNVSNNEIDDAKVPALFKLPELQFIDLRGTYAYKSAREFNSSVTVRVPLPIVVQEEIDEEMQDNEDEDDGNAF